MHIHFIKKTFVTTNNFTTYLSKLYSFEIPRYFFFKYLPILVNIFSSSEEQ